MPIDTSMYSTLKAPEIESPVNALSKIAMLRHYQNENALVDMTMQDKQRAINDQNALTSAIRSNLGPDGTINHTGVVNALAQGGSGHLIQTYQQQLLGNRKTEAEIGKTTAEGGKATAEAGQIDNNVAVKRMETVGQTLGALSEIPGGATPQHITNAVQHLVDIGVIDPTKAGAIIQQMPQDPAQIKAWLKMGQQRVMSAKDQMSFTTPDANTVANNKTSIMTTGMNNATLIKTTGMNNATQVKTTQMHLDQPQYDSERGVLVNNNTGLATPVKSATGQPLPLKDAPQKIQDAQSVLGLIDMAGPMLKNANGGYVGTGVTNVKSALGINSEAGNANAQLRALEGALVARMPKMSGPQSDKDVLLYRQMAAQIGDSTVPVPQRQAALQVVKEITNKYLNGQGIASGATSAPAGVPADIAALLQKHGGK